MNEYKKFGYYYDEVMASINYELWVEFIEPYINKKSSILDLACGSGTLCILLSLLGYKVTGLDLSETILEIAKEKTKINRQTIKYHCMDMIKFKLDEKFDLITCFFDSVNFLKSKTEVQEMLSNVSTHLKPNGYFICDIFSNAMLKEYDNNIIDEDYGNFSIKWTTSKDIHDTLTHNITITEDGEPITEIYKEYYYQPGDLISADFKLVKIVGDFNDDLQPDDERILLVFKKN